MCAARDEQAGATGAGAPAAGAGASCGLGPVSHAAPFQLLFAVSREPGRSDVSAVSPRALPATVTGKFYSREAADAGGSECSAAAESAALQRVRAAFALGPRERLAEPELSSHEYGWWSVSGAGAGTGAGGEACPARLRHHVRASAWLRGRLRVLAAERAPR